MQNQPLVDRTTKLLLAAIAFCLFWLCVSVTPILSVARAQTTFPSTITVNLKHELELGGKWVLGRKPYPIVIETK